MTIYVCGDSTAATYGPERAPSAGWGQALEEVLPGVPVVNAAAGGRSSKSFLAEGRLIAIEKELQAGDLLLIQFTHNDTSDLVWRHTNPWTSFQGNLSIFIDTARQHGAIPVLMTPICRRYFQNGEMLPSHGEYPDAIRALAVMKGVQLIDMYQMSVARISAMGDPESRKLYMHVAPGLYPEYPDGQADDTHTNLDGARFYAGMAAEQLLKLRLVQGR